MGKVVTDHAKKPVCLVRKDQENCNLHLNKKTHHALSIEQ